MAIVTRKVSDITGTEAPEDAFAVVIVRQHPKVDAPKMMDALPNELDDLKEVGDLVILELRLPGGVPKEMYIKYADFVKLVPDETVQNAAGTRGRRPGFRPGNGG